jgi:hypothetical protein
MDQALQYLARAQNPDGGWGYQLPGDSFTEPTALGLIAVLGSDSGAAASAASWLLKTQRHDGGWGAMRGDSESGWQTSVAVWALSLGSARDSAGLDAAVTRGASWLVSNRSRSLALPNPATRLEGKLTGWPWTTGTFGWVIPTGLALVALKASGDSRARGDVLAEAVALLADRRCQDGGWNWGNPLLFGTALPPYATETSIAVLGLLAAGKSAATPEVGAALDWLAVNLDPDTGVTATAWGLLTLRAAGRGSSGALAEARLRSAQQPDGSWRNSPHATALATLALADTIRALPNGA